MDARLDRPGGSVEQVRTQRLASNRPARSLLDLHCPFGRDAIVRAPLLRDLLLDADVPRHV